MRTAIHQVPSKWTRHIIELAVESGADADALWAASDLDRNQLDEWVPEEEHLRIWRAIMKTLRDPGFPMRVAGGRGIDEYALLGLACKTAHSVREAAEHLIRFLSIWDSSIRCELRPQGSSALLILRGPSGGLGRRCARESTLGQIANAMREVCQLPVCPERVYFPHPAPEDIRAQQRFFGCPIEFDAELCAMQLSQATLERELALADDGLSSYLVAQLEELAARRKPPQALTDKVRHVIGQLLPGGVPKLAQVADKLDMAPRTLQRQLSAAGTSFAELTEHTRRDLAIELLKESELSVAELSFVLGFSEPSAFHRAFKRWTGTTPASVRKA